MRLSVLGAGGGFSGPCVACWCGVGVLNRVCGPIVSSIALACLRMSFHVVWAAARGGDADAIEEAVTMWWVLRPWTTWLCSEQGVVLLLQVLCGLVSWGSWIEPIAPSLQGPSPHRCGPGQSECWGQPVPVAGRRSRRSGWRRALMWLMHFCMKSEVTPKAAISTKSFLVRGGCCGPRRRGLYHEQGVVLRSIFPPEGEIHSASGRPAPSNETQL